MQFLWISSGFHWSLAESFQSADVVVHLYQAVKIIVLTKERLECAQVGAAKLQGDITLNYAGIEGFRIAGKQGIWLIGACQLVLMGGPEYARWVGIESLQPVGVFLPGTQSYPGASRTAGPVI